MSSSVATNASVQITGKKRFLEINNLGAPVDKVVPQTIQNYTGAGNETISLDGSSVFWVNSTIAGGALTVSLSAADMRNLLNREITVIVPAAATSNVVFDLPAGGAFISTAALEDTNNTFTVASDADTYVKKFVFISATRVAVV